MNSENDKRFTLYIIETIIISNQTIISNHNIKSVFGNSYHKSVTLTSFRHFDQFSLQKLVKVTNINPSGIVPYQIHVVTLH